METGDFYFSLAVSAFTVAVLMVLGAAGGMHPLFALSLLSMSVAGFFAMAELRRLGFSPPQPEYYYGAIALAAFLAASTSLFSLSYLAPLSFLPLSLLAPALGGALRNYFSSG